VGGVGYAQVQKVSHNVEAVKKTGCGSPSPWAGQHSSTFWQFLKHGTTCFKIQSLWSFFLSIFSIV
jgi:hypothetical protein